MERKAAAELTRFESIENGKPEQYDYYSFVPECGRFMPGDTGDTGASCRGGLGKDASKSFDECTERSTKNLPPSGLERMLRRSPHASSFRGYTPQSLTARRHSDGAFPFLPKPNSRVMEKLTPHRIQRWSYSFLDLLSDHVGIQMFLAFLEKEFSAENLRFWLACQELKQTPRMNVPNLVNKIFSDFLDEDSTHSINVDSKTYNHVKLNLTNPSYNTFDEAQEHIFQLMKTDSYPRFIRSDRYNQILKDTSGKSRKK